MVSLVFPYRGPSMRGTFQAGDLLIVVPVSWGAIRPGDVIAFRSSSTDGTELLLCHRVVAWTAGGLVTRGDWSGTRDPAPVQADELVGRVSQVERQGRSVRVAGGRAGRLWAGLVLLRRRVARVLGRPYRRLRASGLARRVWRPEIAEMQLAVQGEKVVKYLHKGRRVAQLWPEQGRFWCRKPYDLVIENPVDD